MRDGAAVRAGPVTELTARQRQCLPTFLTSDLDKYANFVNHPRFGRRPKWTGLHPSPLDLDVHLNANTSEIDEIAARYEAVMRKKWPHADQRLRADRPRRISNTAIRADLSRQTPATVAVTHYFDLEITCRDCRRPFIFFAEEQRHWYEDLGFPVDADCVRCPLCRKTDQTLRRRFQRFSNAVARHDLTDDEFAMLVRDSIFLWCNGLLKKRDRLNRIKKQARRRIPDHRAAREIDLLVAKLTPQHGPSTD